MLRYEEVPAPEPKPGEVLVRVHAVGINPPDWYVRGGMTNMPGETRPTFAFPMIPGTDVSGVVEAVAADVDGFSAGDEVFGLLRFPSFNGSVGHFAVQLAKWKGARVIAVASGAHESFLRRLGADEFKARSCSASHEDEFVIDQLPQLFVQRGVAPADMGGAGSGQCGADGLVRTGDDR